MSLDFCMLCLLFLIILEDDMSRWGMKKNFWYWVVLVFFLGLLIYLFVCLFLLLIDIFIILG